MMEPSASNRFRFDILLFVIALIVLGADQTSKNWVVENIPLNTTYPLVPGLSSIFVLTHITNQGAAFGLFPQLSIVFTFIAFGVSLVIVFYQRSIPTHQWLVRLSLGLQLGGAIGNLVDRLRYGYVIDMFYTGIFPMISFPVFNIADSAIVTGVILLMWHLTQTPKPAPALTPPDAPDQIKPQGDGLG